MAVFIPKELEREEEENNEEIGIEKEKREKDVQKLIKHYKNNRKNINIGKIFIDLKE